MRGQTGFGALALLAGFGMSLILAMIAGAAGADDKPLPSAKQKPGIESIHSAVVRALPLLVKASALFYRRGLEFLIKSQRDDGTWHIKSRSRPFQTYFESGFPHGPGQFISSAGSGWATAALVLACPRSTSVRRPR